MHACKNDKDNIVVNLLFYKADPNIRDKKGQTALTYTRNIRNQQQIVRYLLKYGADPNIKDEHGNTALFYINDPNSIYMMINKTINPNITITNINEKNNNDETALFLNIIFKNHETVKSLLENGADPNIKTVKSLYKNGAFKKESITPLMYAKEHNYEKIVKILENHGAVSEAKDGSKKNLKKRLNRSNSKRRLNRSKKNSKRRLFN